MFKRLLSSAVVFGLAATAPPFAASSGAQTAGPRAQPVQGAACAPRSEMIAALTQRFGEVQRGAGLVDAAQLIEIWSAPGSGSWTVLVTRVDGRSCILASGRHWRDAPKPPVGEPS